MLLRHLSSWCGGCVMKFGQSWVGHCCAESTYAEMRTNIVGTCCYDCVLRSGALPRLLFLFRHVMFAAPNRGCGLLVQRRLC